MKKKEKKKKERKDLDQLPRYVHPGVPFILYVCVCARRVCAFYHFEFLILYTVCACSLVQSAHLMVIVFELIRYIYVCFIQAQKRLVLCMLFSPFISCPSECQVFLGRESKCSRCIFLLLLFVFVFVLRVRGWQCQNPSLRSAKTTSRCNYSPLSFIHFMFTSSKKTEGMQPQGPLVGGMEK